MTAGALHKAAAMSPDELRFRIGCEGRKWIGWLRTAVKPAAWRRADLASVLRRDVPGSAWREAHAALSAGDYPAAHAAFAQHFSERRSAFPLNAPEVKRISATIRATFPSAPREAAGRAESIRHGSYDLLGYRRLHFGSPPDWHADPVHGRRSPSRYWARINYLDARYGDHKLIWELNRHQHWLTLGRAHALTGDARYYDEFVAQFESWLPANPPLWGTNWASMLELAFRCLSWLWALEFFSTSAAAGRSGRIPWMVDLLLAVYRQLTHLQQNLSYYFSPNTHLTGEALALYVAGHALPELSASWERRDVGRATLVREAERQIRGDGGHAELSPHYHRYSTDFYLLALAVARAAQDPAARIFEDAARRQAEFLRTITDDRGYRPQFGDDDGGQLFPICGRRSDDCSDTLAIAAHMLDRPDLAVGRTPEEVYWMCGVSAHQLQAGTDRTWRSAALPASGYYVMRTSAGDHLVFDAGPHGYLNGGHAHSDALSVVLTVAGLPLLIDPGTATYTMDLAMRDRFRSTAMHNTLVLDGQPQSEPSGPFHWRRTAEATAHVWRAAGDCEYVEGTHEGYAPRRHTRGILALHGIGWWILDHVLGDGTADIGLHWHLHPQVRVTDLGESSVALAGVDGSPQAIASSLPLAPLPAGHELAACSLAYGVVEQAPVLRGEIATTLPTTVATFIPSLASMKRGLAIERVNVTNGPGTGWHAAAFRVRWENGAMLLVAAIERTGLTDGVAAPGVHWGTDALTTNARLAVLVEDAAGRSDFVCVNGSSVHVRSRADAVNLPERVPILRKGFGRELVSTVQCAGHDMLARQ